MSNNPFIDKIVMVKENIMPGPFKSLEYRLFLIESMNETHCFGHWLFELSKGSVALADVQRFPTSKELIECLTRFAESHRGR